MSRYEDAHELIKRAGFDSRTDFRKRTKMSDKVVDQFVMGKLPTNHPYLPVLAAILKIQPDQLTPFLSKRQMAPRAHSVLRTRLAHTPHLQRMLKHALPPAPEPVRAPSRVDAHLLPPDRRREAYLLPDPTDNFLVKRRKELGLTLMDFAAKAGASASTILKIETGVLAPNSPVVEAAAQVYGFPVEKLARHQKAPPMSDSMRMQQVGRLATLKAHGGMSAVRARNGNGAGMGNGNGHTNGNGPKAKGIFKKMDLDRREALRTLTNTANINAMKGIRETTVSTQMILDVLRELYLAKGVEGNVVVDFVFDKIFD